MKKLVRLTESFRRCDVDFALDARLRVLPKLRDDNVKSMLPHILTVTTLSVVFVFAGVGIRIGGWW